MAVEELRSAAHRAAAAITERRTACDDPALSQLPDPADLAGVAGHAYRHRRGIPADVMQKDVKDAWKILRYLEHQIDEHRLGVLKAADLAGMTYSDLAPIVGVTGRTGVEALKSRLSAAVSGAPKDQQAAREARRIAREAQTRADRLTAVLQAAVRTLAAAHGQLPPEAQSHLDDLIADTVATPRSVMAQINLVIRSTRAVQPGPDLTALITGIQQQIEETQQ